MVPLARKHLFSSLELKTDAAAERLDTILSSNPGIALYVRRLKYGIVAPIPKHMYRILDLVKQSPSLHSLELWTELQFSWDHLPIRMRELIAALIQVPSITDLHIWRFFQFPSSILLGCTHITNFSCAVLTVKPNQATPLLAHSRSLALKPLSLTIEVNAFDSLATLSHEGAIDFSRVEQATFEVRSSGDLQIAASALRTMENIHTLKIHAEKRVTLTGLGEALMEHKTLKKLEFSPSIDLDNEHPGPLCGLNNELKMIAGHNIIEAVGLNISIQMDDELDTDTDEWSIFDTLLTTPGAFPALKRVSLNILWVLESEESEAVLDDVADWKEQLVKLWQSQSVELIYEEEYQI